jgi:hypothetical protein
MRSFENVREQLLRAGIAPRHARRYVTELREHLADLVSQERASGLDEAQAGQKAEALLGSDAQLAEAMTRSATRSLTARAPWSVLTALPVALFVAVTVLSANLVMTLMWPMRGVALADLPGAYGFIVSAAGVLTGYVLGPALAAMCIAIAIRQRLASAWVWIGLGLLSLLSGPVGFHVQFIPSVGGGGRTVYSMARLVYHDGHPDLAATLGAALVRAAILFAIAGSIYRFMHARLLRT